MIDCSNHIKIMVPVHPSENSQSAVCLQTTFLIHGHTTVSRHEFQNHAPDQAPTGPLNLVKKTS